MKAFQATASRFLFVFLISYSVFSQDVVRDAPVALTEKETSAGGTLVGSPAKIESVLLYSDFAYITKQTKAEFIPGNVEVLLGEVPFDIVDRSVTISIPDSSRKIRIKGIRVIEKVSRKYKSAETKELEGRREKLLLTIATKSREVQDLLDLEQSLKSIKPTFREEDSITEKLDLDSISGFRKTYSDLVEENTKIRLSKLEDLDRVREEFYIVSAKLDHLAQGDLLRRKELRADIESDARGNLPIEFRYLIRGANWYPRYTLDLKPDGNEAELGWYALVKNETGEDWNGIRLEFSTANPNLDIDLPDYKEWRISSRVVVQEQGYGYQDKVSDGEGYYPAAEAAKPAPSGGATTKNRVQRKQEAKKKDKVSKSEEEAEANENPLLQSRTLIENNYKDRANSLRVEENLDELKGDLARQKSSFDTGQFDQSIRYGKEALRRLSGLRESSRLELKEIESETQALLNRSSQLNSDRKYIGNLVSPGSSAEGFDFRYIAQSREKIPSDKTLNRVFLRKRTVPVEPGYESSPLTKQEAYLTVVSKNLEREPLLSGPLEIYSGENLLGTTSVSTLKPGEKIRMELGPDHDIKVQRREEKFEDKSGLISSRKTIRYKVQITLKNNKRRMVNVRLIDRIPYTVDDSVSIKWISGTDQPERTEDGILTYEFQIDSGATKKIQFEYVVSYPAENILHQSNGSGSY
ncbi:hypothetical protein CH373_01255 [Leptospira perolatii]|uniref:DUF4139 domain-containing protein n=1 Tax=Leptospira perolatii TaxID=2023191 RepID=A0A2M9ZRK4_9LEPT|nr:DUF4139 domain-containing protein [Leptospira perolatii]PJZ71174.1 hypothetical protein CH360_01255 [Leptospira perolatii]PJZ74707.1 hypothetical protein CH373_01255 [Leptospira perolatii]